MQSNLKSLAMTIFERRQADLDLRAENVRYMEPVEFVDGTLVSVTFDSYKGAAFEGKYVNRIYFVDGKPRLFFNDQEFITALEGRRHSIILDLLSAKVVSAIMALAMLAAMIWLVVTTSDKESGKLVIQSLAGGFGLAAGFFFAKTGT